MKKLLTGIVLFAMSAMAYADTIILQVESPQQFGTMQGVGVVQGWAVSHEPIELVEYYIDDNEDVRYVLPYGGSRLDVANHFKGEGFPHAEDSGFGATFYYGLIEDGEHTITVVVHTETLIRESTVPFTVVSFEDDKWKKVANTDWMKCRTDYDGGFTLYGISLNKVYYPEIGFTWNNASQNFSIINIETDVE